MKNFYTINYKLFESRQSNEVLLDVQTADLAYKSRENAFKAVQERIKTHVELCNYKPTSKELIIETETSELGQKFRIEYEIKEHWLSEFEKGE